MKNLKNSNIMIYIIGYKVICDKIIFLEESNLSLVIKAGLVILLKDILLTRDKQLINDKTKNI